MSKVRALVLLTMVLGLASGAALASDAPFLQAGTTPEQTAVFIPFWSVFDATEAQEADGIGDISTALSVSNVLEAPDAIEEALLEVDELSDTTGTIEFYFWVADGTLITYETNTDEFGNGVLNEDGELAPGQTLTVSVEDILIKIDEMPEPGVPVSGYGWVIANFDAVQGTVNVYLPSLGFAQSLNMEPTLGHFPFLAGIPLPFGAMLLN